MFPIVLLAFNIFVNTFIYVVIYCGICYLRCDCLYQMGKKIEKTASAQYFDAPPNSSKKMCNKMVSLRERLELARCTRVLQEWRLAKNVSNHKCLVVRRYQPQVCSVLIRILFVQPIKPCSQQGHSTARNMIHVNYLYRNCEAINRRQHRKHLFT